MHMATILLCLAWTTAVLPLSPIAINAKLTELKLWCNDIYINPSIEARDTAIGSGFYATQNLNTATNIIAIPLDCCLFDETIKENIIAPSDSQLYIEPFIYEQLLENSTLTPLALSMYLLQLRNSKSEYWSLLFQPFLHTLPNKPPNIPLFWDKPLAKLIRYTSANAVLTNQILLFYEFLHKFKLRSLVSSAFQKELLILYSMVSSRIYTVHGYKGSEENTKHIFVPVIDSINHNPSLANVAFHYNATLNIIQINVIKSVWKNAQIFLNYGRHSNSVLLAQYGFVLQNNMSRFTDNALFIDTKDRNYNRKRNLLHSFPSYLTSKLRFGAHGLQLKAAKSFFIASLQPKDFSLFTIGTIMAIESEKGMSVDEIRRVALALHNIGFGDIGLENELRFALCQNGQRLYNVLSKQYTVAQTMALECETLKMDKAIFK